MKSKIRKKKFAVANQSKLLLTLDWLTLNVEDNFVLLDNKDKTFGLGSLMIERVEKSTVHFKQMCYIWFQGSRIAVVTFDSRNQMILKGRAHVKFENHLFYNNEIQAMVELVIQEFQLKSIKVSRVDIACDGVFFHEMVSKYEIQKYKNRFRSIKSNGQIQATSDMGIHRVNDLDNIRPVGVGFEGIAMGCYDSFTVGQVGSRDTGKSKSYRFGRYYNKTKELKDNNHKEYITEYYEKNGFSGDVYRFEIEMRSEFLAEICDFNYSHLFDFGALRALFRTGCSNFFEYRYKSSSTTNISRCDSVELFEGIEDAKYVRAKREVKKTLRPVQQMVKRLVIESVELLNKPKNACVVLANNYLSTVRTLIAEYRLKEWFAYKWQWIVQEMQDRLNLINGSFTKIPDQQLTMQFYGA